MTLKIETNEDPKLSLLPNTVLRRIKEVILVAFPDKPLDLTNLVSLRKLDVGSLISGTS